MSPFESLTPNSRPGPDDAGGGDETPDVNAATGEGASGDFEAAGMVPADERPAHPLVEGPERRTFRIDEVGATVAALSLSPEESFQRFDWNGGWTRALLFVTIIAGPCGALGYAIETYLRTGAIERQVHPLAFVTLLFVAPPLYTLLRALVIHTVLVAQGTILRPFAATYRAIAYSAGAVSIACLLPYVGLLIFLTWDTMVEASALRAAHRLTLGQVLIATLLPTVALIAALAARATFEFIVP